MRVPSFSILVKATNDCNLDCSYCFDRPMRQKLQGHHLSLDAIEHLVNMCADYADRVVWYWHGGEPTLMGKQFYKDAQAIINSRYDCDFVQRMQSNGINLVKDSSWLSFLEDIGIYCGISYDSLTQYERTKQQIDYTALFNHQIETVGTAGAITVINSSNVGKMVEIYEEMKHKYDSKFHLTFNPIFNVSAEKRTGLEVPIETFVTNYTDFLHHAFFDIHNGITETKSLHILQLLLGILNNPPCHFSDCRLAWLCVNSNGDIYPCDFANESCNLGNLKDFNSIKGVFNSTTYINYFNGIEDRLTTHCKPCGYYSVCKGACNAIHISGSPIGTYNYFNEQLCKQTKGLINSVYNILQEIEDVTEINSEYRVILNTVSYHTHKVIEDYLTEHLNKPVHLRKRMDCFEDITVTPQYKIWKLFNNIPGLSNSQVIVNNESIIQDLVNQIPI